MAWLRSLVITDPFIVLSTIVFGSISLVISFFDATGSRQIRVARRWAQSLLWGTRVTVQVEGLDRIDPRGSYVFAANHLSYIDTPVVLSYIPVQFRFLAKKGLFQIPFLGTHLARAGHIPVPRDDPRASVKTMGLAAQAIRDRGVSVLIFPEGGRSHDGNLQPFKDGASYIAIKAGVPVVPIVLVGTRKILPFGGAVFRPGHVRLRIGDPIPTAGLTLRDRGELTRQMRDRITALLDPQVLNANS